MIIFHTRKSLLRNYLKYGEGEEISKLRITPYTQEKTALQDSNWHKALLKANEALRCGAKTRTRRSGVCQSPAMANGRCRMHGGKSPGAPCGKKHGRYKNGHYTKAAVQKRQEFQELIRTIKSTIKNVEQIS